MQTIRQSSLSVLCRQVFVDSFIVQVQSCSASSIDQPPTKNPYHPLKTQKEGSARISTCTHLQNLDYHQKMIKKIKNFYPTLSATCPLYGWGVLRSYAAAVRKNSEIFGKIRNSQVCSDSEIFGAESATNPASVRRMSGCISTYPDPSTLPPRMHMRPSHLRGRGVIPNCCNSRPCCFL